MSKICGTCLFWNSPDPGNPSPMGQCRKGPPTPFMIIVGTPPVSEAERKIIALAGARPQPPQQQPAFLSAWPAAPASGWCGEWKEVENSVAPAPPV